MKWDFCPIIKYGILYNLFMGLMPDYNKQYRCRFGQQDKPGYNRIRAVNIQQGKVSKYGFILIKLRI